jgi:hypothetical protein
LVTAEIGTTGVCWDYVTYGTSHEEDEAESEEEEVDKDEDASDASDDVSNDVAGLCPGCELCGKLGNVCPTCENTGSQQGA